MALRLRQNRSGATRRKVKLPKADSPLEALLERHLRASGISYQREFRFAALRKWRVDFLIEPDSSRICVEVEGGHWGGGRHTRGPGFEKDCEKYNELTMAGYRLFRFTGPMVKSGYALAVIQRALDGDKLGRA